MKKTIYYLLIGLTPVLLLADLVKDGVKVDTQDVRIDLIEGQTNNWSSGISAALATGVNAQATANAALPKAGGTMSGTLDMGGNTITNVGTNSIVFANGTKLSIGSNGVVHVGSGTNISPLITAGTFGSYETPQTIYYADGLTLKKSGSTFSVQNWIPDNLTSLRFETWNHWQTQSRGLLDGPGYWFSDQNGIITNQSSGYTYSSGYKNQLTIPGASLSCLKLNGTSSGYVEIPNSASWDNAPNNMVSISFWVCPSNHTSTPGPFIMKSDDGANRAFDGFTGDGGAHQGLWFWTTAGHVSTWVPIVFTNGQWSHVVVSWDGENQRSYFNGNLVDTQALGGTLAKKNMPIRIGQKSNGGWYWVGSITQIGWWTNALSGEEVSTLYTSPDLVGEITNKALGIWRCQDGSGSVLTDAISTNNGTLYAGATWGTYPLTPGVIATTNMTLTATNTTLSFVPASTYASSVINVGSETIAASNVVLAASRDGGTTFSTAPVTITDSWDVSNKLVSANISMTNQPVGSNVFPRIYLTNGCPAVTVKGMAFPCGE